MSTPKLILILITSSFIVSFAAASIQQCSTRGGCMCDCSWTVTYPCSITKDDGTCCFSCCCGNSTCSPTWGQCGGQAWNGPTCCSVGNTCMYYNSWYSQCLPGTAPTPVPTPTVPTPVPTPTIPTPVPTLPQYCPAIRDFVFAYGLSSTLFNQGWHIIGGAAVATKASFNLLGGSVSFDINVNKTLMGVNANIYTISPTSISATGFTQANYCDGAKTDSTWCPEVDWIEVNGNCCSQTTLHSIKGPGTGCTAWGCAEVQDFNGRSNFHMNIAYDQNGVMTVTRDGQIISSNTLTPMPLASDWDTVKSYYQNYGALIYSSQWVGWTCTCKNDAACSKNNYAQLDKSEYRISNLVIVGKVVQGPTPALC